MKKWILILLLISMTVFTVSCNFLPLPESDPQDPDTEQNADNNGTDPNGGTNNGTTDDPNGNTTDDPNGGAMAPKAVSVTFVVDDEVLTVVNTYEGETVTTAPTPAAKPAYSWIGWFAEGANTSFDFSAPLGDSDLTLTARWSEVFLYREEEGGIVLTSYIGEESNVLLPHEMYGKTVLSFGTIFQNSAITSIDIGEGYTEIPAGAFSGCTELTNVILPATTVRLGASSFAGCAKIRKFTIPQNVIYIESGVFVDCPTMLIYCKVSRAQNGWVENWSEGAKQVNFNYDDGNLLPVHYF